MRDILRQPPQVFHGINIKYRETRIQGIVSISKM